MPQAMGYLPSTNLLLRRKASMHIRWAIWGTFCYDTGTRFVFCLLQKRKMAENNLRQQGWRWIILPVVPINYQRASDVQLAFPPSFLSSRGLPWVCPRSICP